MDDFASCYFCGTAIEAPVREYPVVPDEIDPDVDTGATVALCPTCRRKLDTILEPVVAEVEQLHADLMGSNDSSADPVARGPADPAAQSSSDPANADESNDGGSDEDPASPLADLTVPGPADLGEGATTEDADPGEVEDAESESDETGDAESEPKESADADATADDERRVFADADDAGADPGTTAAGAGGRTGDAADRPADEGAGGSGADESDDGPTDGSIGEPASFEGSESPDETANESPDREGDDAGSVENGGNDIGSTEDMGDDAGSVENAGGDAGSSGDADEDAESTGGETDRQVPIEDVPVEAYNKIVKLLKNQEFPVERREIEDLASSAYDFPRDDCRRAVDAMIDRGVLVEDGGRLRKGNA